MAVFSHLKVLELAGVLAGPAVGMFFAELGAEVIKIEPPTGDVTRTWRLPAERNLAFGEPTAYFSAVNWGKKSVVLNISLQENQAILHNLLAQADVLITNFRASSAAKLGLAPDTLQERYPRLIHANVTGYGEDNPRPGFDAIAQAESGFMFLNAEPNGIPLKMPVALIDLLAAHQLKEGIVTGLYARERSGKGAYISVSLIGAAVTALANQASAWLYAGVKPQPLGSAHPSIAPYGNLFITKDNRLIMPAVGNDRQFAQFCSLLGVAHLANDERFSTNAARVQNRVALTELIAAAVAKFELVPLLATMTASDVPVGAVRTVEEALHDPAVQHLILSHTQSYGKGIRTVAFVADGWNEEVITPPPVLGADTQTVLQPLTKS